MAEESPMRANVASERWMKNPTCARTRWAKDCRRIGDMPERRVRTGQDEAGMRNSGVWND
jgi:hypothetical protein